LTFSKTLKSFKQAYSSLSLTPIALKNCLIVSISFTYRILKVKA
jgi:hypothetical protein